MKNFSLITRDKKITLSPVYDLLNTTIAQQHAKEELALPLNGKKSNLKKRHLIDYFAIEQLQLNQKVVTDILQEFKVALPKWKLLLTRSFLSEPMREKYLTLLEERCLRLEL